MKQTSIKIDCAYDELVDTGKLTPNPRNPNSHPEKQMVLLSKIIQHQGFRNAIVVSNLTGFVIKGHARLEAAIRLGMKKCPVDYQDYTDESAEMADMIADNRLGELSEMSLPGLKDLLQELDTGAFDMDLTGFEVKDLEMLMTQLHFDVKQPGQEEIDKSSEELRERFKNVALADLSEMMDLVCPECGADFQIRRADVLKDTKT